MKGSPSRYSLHFSGSHIGHTKLVIMHPRTKYRNAIKRVQVDHVLLVTIILARANTPRARKGDCFGTQNNMFT